MSDKLKVGQKAPNVEAQTYGGEKINLNQFRDKKVVALYFYPKDNTPTCQRSLFD
jgi:thioredoxin-dependent peroxiredoxin